MVQSVKFGLRIIRRESSCRSLTQRFRRGFRLLPKIIWSKGLICKWADEGHELGWDQFRIKGFENNSDHGGFFIRGHNPVEISKSKTEIKIESDLGRLSFDTNSGRLKNICFGGRDLLASLSAQVQESGVLGDATSVNHGSNKITLPSKRIISS